MCSATTVERILFLQERSTELCRELKECLLEERAALIALNFEGLLQTNSRKEELSLRLNASRKQLHAIVIDECGIPDTLEISKFLNEADQKRWDKLRAEWLKEWQQTRNWCEANQNFMKHSQKNLGQLVEHLKGLFGQSVTYSAKGVKVAGQSQGKVVEARYNAR